MFKRLNRLLGRFDAREYWRTRHAELGTSLASVGHVALTEDENERDYRAKAARLSALLRQHFVNPGQCGLLDAGCGTGVLSKLYSGLGFHVVGVDFAQEAIRAARANIDGEFICGDLASFELGRTFDVVVCIDVLFHVVHDRHWERVLTNLAAHTSDKGMLFIQESLRHDDGARSTAASPRHVRWRTIEDYKDVSKRLGMKIDCVSSYVLPCEAVRKDILRLWR